MKPKFALFLIFIISIIGILFSGYLSYAELVQKTCTLGSCTLVKGIPACVYGLGMYIIIFFLTLAGLFNKH